MLNSEVPVCALYRLGCQKSRSSSPGCFPMNAAFSSSPTTSAPWQPRASATYSYRTTTRARRGAPCGACTSRTRQVKLVRAVVGAGTWPSTWCGCPPLAGWRRARLRTCAPALCPHRLCPRFCVLSDRPSSPQVTTFYCRRRAYHLDDPDLPSPACGDRCSPKDRQHRACAISPASSAT